MRTCGGYLGRQMLCVPFVGGKLDSVGAEGNAKAGKVSEMLPEEASSSSGF